MRRLILATAFLGGCAVARPDGRCTAFGVVARPDRCGTATMRREWAAVGGVDGKPNRYASAVADWLTAMDLGGGSWTALLIPVPGKPGRVRVEYMRTQVTTPADAGGRRF